MSRFHPSRFGRILVLILGLWAVAAAAQADEFRYRYVSLDQVELPPGFTGFFPSGLQDNGRVYGTVCDDVCSDPRIAVYADGAVTVLQLAGFGGSVNARGTVGGTVTVDPQNFIVQAALFRTRRNEVELIPPQPGETYGFVLALNDQDTALVESDDALGGVTYVRYGKGRSTVLDFGPSVANPRFLGSVTTGKFINNEGIIAGLTSPAGNPFDGARGFRFDPRTGKAALLEPVSPDTLAWGLAINNRGDVLGYSFVVGAPGAPYHERIGVWDGNGDFKTYFDQTISTNLLVFNDANVIVVSRAPGGNSYLLPEPGLRLNLADLVENMPAGQNLRYVFNINNHGDMLGSGDQGSFLLKRIGAGGP